MVTASVLLKDLRYEYILQKIRELELKTHMEMSLHQKLLLAETGTVEQSLGILTNSQISIHVIRQIKTCKTIKRDIYILNRQTGKKLLEASSTIFVDCLPRMIIKSIERKNQGIGNIITTFQLETFRKIVKIGCNSRTGSIFRIYHIIYNKNIAFKIKEVFPNKL
jgi:chorismate-pyruvate lyase